MMDDFGRWFRRPVQAVTEKAAIPECLQGRQDPDAEGGYTYPCNVCEKDCPIYCEPEMFDPNNHYCGGSDRCCP